MSQQQYRSVLSTDGEAVANTMQAMTGNKPKQAVRQAPRTSSVGSGAMGAAPFGQTSLSGVPQPQKQFSEQALKWYDAAMNGRVDGNGQIIEANTPTTETTPSTPTVSGAPSGTPQTPVSYADDAMRDWRGYVDNIDKMYGGNILAFNPSGLSGEELANYYRDVNIYNGIKNNIDAYDSQVKMADQTAREKEQYASYRRALMEKYMPETLNAMGLGGLGVSQSAVLQMNNNYDNYVSGALSERDAAKSTALLQTNQQASQIMGEHNAQQAAKVEQDQARAYEEAVSKLAASEGDDYFEYDKFLEKYKGKVSKDQYGELEEAINSYKRNKILQESFAKMDSGEGIDYDDVVGQLKELGMGESQLKQFEKEYREYLPGTEGASFTAEKLTSFVDDSALKGRRFKIKGDPIDINDSPYKLNFFSAMSIKHKNRIKEIQNAAQSGQLKNGDIVDFNYGKGEKLCIYKDGMFYEIEEI